MSVRAEKVASLIKRVLTTPINDLAQEYSAGLVTVTSVKMSKDLQIARVYISCYNGKISPQQFINIIEENISTIRQYVGANVRLRHTPELKFFIDDTLDQMEHIQNLLKSLKDEKKKDK